MPGKSFLLPLFLLVNTLLAQGQLTNSLVTPVDSAQTGNAPISAQLGLSQQVAAVEPEWSVTGSKVFWAIVVALAGFILIRYLTKLLERLGERWSKFRLTIKGLVPIIRISGWTIVLYIIIVDILAPPFATIVAVTASAGIAVGFASQDILKNIFGGIMILFDRPFQVGDKIQVGSHYGEVVSIGLRTVRIVSPDDSLVSIPNSEIVNTSVSNSNSGAHYCQVVAELFLPAELDLARTRILARDAAATSRYIYLNKPIQVIFKHEIYQGRTHLKLRLKAYVLDIRYEFAFASEMTEILLEALLAEKLISPSQLKELPDLLESTGDQQLQT
jgi:small-conductance mechanosensitive channel